MEWPHYFSVIDHQGMHSAKVQTSIKNIKVKNFYIGIIIQYALPAKKVST